MIYPIGAGDSDPGVLTTRYSECNSHPLGLAKPVELYEVVQEEAMTTTEYTPSVVEAVIALKRRYAEICLQYPLTRDTVTEAGYVCANLASKIRNMRLQHENHASDCSVWVMERCDCVTGKDAR